MTTINELLAIPLSSEELTSLIDFINAFPGSNDETKKHLAEFQEIIAGTIYDNITTDDETTTTEDTKVTIDIKHLNALFKVLDDHQKADISRATYLAFMKLTMQVYATTPNDGEYCKKKIALYCKLADSNNVKSLSMTESYLEEALKLLAFLKDNVSAENHIELNQLERCQILVLRKLAHASAQSGQYHNALKILRDADSKQDKLYHLTKRAEDIQNCLLINRFILKIIKQEYSGRISPVIFLEVMLSSYEKKFKELSELLNQAIKNKTQPQAIEAATHQSSSNDSSSSSFFSNILNFADSSRTSKKKQKISHENEYDECSVSSLGSEL